MNFPTVYCQRAIDQLHCILKSLKAGYEVQYFLISLSPIVNIVEINDDLKFKKYTELLLKCINQGMIFKSFNIFFEDNKVKVGKEVTLLI